tara:strand:+ start:918 stop:1082 length:165 start_codon:yes stop_codon:yes gene_type:complete
MSLVFIGRVKARLTACVIIIGRRAGGEESVPRRGQSIPLPAVGGAMLKLLRLPC